jgi:acyl transferase domain-containing protein/NAD(P)-dependent dehydrogenase (short-subunit alcohol dehydrogenase family)/acyl carrier protein
MPSDPNGDTLDLSTLLQQIREANAQLRAVRRARSEPIAIIGMACRFPGGADTPAAFWDLLVAGRDAIREVPPDRWDIDAYYDPDPQAPGRMASRWGGFLERIDGFDAGFFEMSPREAMRLDPQQRLMLELAHEALDDAGIPLDTLRGSQTGVFAGIYNTDYQTLQDPLHADVYAGTGTSNSMAAGRLSYLLDLQGPSMAVDTACSSSLVALHLACNSLRAGECDLAIVGGVNVIAAPEPMVVMSKLMALSPDGRCRSFDAGANGYVRAEGGGVIVLRRLGDAEVASDHVQALVRGSAVNHDGRSAGLTAPNPASQEKVIWTALARAGIGPAQVGYVETHGTGTPLGDPIEIAALSSVFSGSGGRCALGAVKTNVGHLEAAAGMAGLVKAVLALQHGEIPANIHFQRLNPRIVLDGTSFRIPAAREPWTDRDRFAGVSSFGVSGTNAHVVLSAAPPAVEGIGSPGTTTLPLPQGEEECPVALAGDPPAMTGEPVLLVVSGHGRAAMQANAARLAALLRSPTRQKLADIAHTALARRSHHRDRLAVVGDSAEALAVALEHAAVQAPPPAGPLIWVFSGQGSQWPGMQTALAAIGAMLDPFAQAIAGAGGPDVAALLVAPPDDAAWQRPDLVQPALFAAQCALAAALREAGVTPDIVIGHSMGEVAAAYFAGALGLAEASRVITARSAALTRIAGRGAMVLLDMDADEATALLADAGLHGVSLAALNGPQGVVLSGDHAGIERVLTLAAECNRFARRIAVDAAAHSPQVDPELADFTAELAELRTEPPSVRLISTVTGAMLTKAPDAAYWAANLRQPVRFWDALRQVLADGPATILEVAPHPILLPGLERTLPPDSATLLATMSRDGEPRRHWLETMAALFAQGRRVAIARLAPAGRVTSLPAYAWQRRRYWLADARRSGPAGTEAGKPSPQAFYDWLARKHDAEAGEIYLTYGILAELVPGFSLARAFAWPERHADLAAAARRSQLELRRLLFRRVDLARPCRVLDFGCGYATDLARLGQRHPQAELVGYTISAIQAGTGARKLAKLGLADRARVLHRDSAIDPFPGQFDLAFGFEVVSHIQDKRALFGNLARHLAPDGTVLVADFAATGRSTIEHAESSSFIVPRDGWADLLAEAGLRIAECVDVTPEVSNIFADPDPAGAIADVRAELGAAVADSIVAYVALGELLRRDLARYVLLVVRPCVAGRDVLRADNIRALAAPRSYTEVADDGDPIPVRTAPDAAQWLLQPVALPARWGSHRIADQTVLPASALLHAAVAVARQTDGVALSDLVFHRAVVADGPTPPQLRLTLADGQLSVEAKEAGRWSAAATARVLPRDHQEMAVHKAPCVLAQSSASPEPAAAFYDRLRAHGTDYAPPLRALVGIAQEPGAASGTLALTDGMAALDACLQAIAAAVPPERIGDASLVALPIGAAALSWHDGGPPTEVRALVRPHAQRDDTLIGEAQLLDAGGTVVFALSGLELRQVPRAVLSLSARVGHYVEQWVPTPPATPDAGRLWTLFASPGQGDALAAALAERGAAVELRSPVEIVSFRPLADGRVCYLADGSVRATVHLQRLIALLRQGDGARLFAVGSRTDPASAPAWGLGTVAALELPARWGASIDPGDSPSPSQLADMLLGWREDGDDRFALAPDGATVPRLAPVPATSAPSFAADPGLTYLITGATGALGRQLARFLVACGARHLVLLSRHADPALAAALDATLGVTALPLAADVADRGAVADLLRRCGADLPPLAMVFHLAADMRGVALESLDAAAIDAMLRPKLDGAIALAGAAAPLVLFSSTAAILGAVGLAHYAAACRGLAAVAATRAMQGLRTLIVHWGTWAASAGEAAAAQRMGLRPMQPDAALYALGGLLSAQADGEVVLADVDWPTLLPVLEARRLRPFLTMVRDPTGATVPTAPTHLLQSLPPAERQRKLTAQVRLQVADLLGFPPDEVADDTGFFQLGLDSITSVQLRNRLEAEFGVALSASTVFNHPSALQLAAEIARLIGGAQEPDTAPDNATPLAGAADDPLLGELLRRIEAA